MKKLACILLSVIVLLGLATAVVWAAPPGQGEGPELVAEMSWDKDAVYAGTTVAVEITIRNEGVAQVPDDAEVKFRLQVWAVDGATEPESTTEEITLDKAAGLGPEDAPLEITQSFDAPAEGNYNLVAVLTGLGDEPLEYSEPLAVQSALPPGIARLFAGLGMFAAVMAILAVGTEVLMDSVKPLLGMKQKVTAMEAFDKLKQELPGQLADLGVDPEARKGVNKLIEDAENKLKQVTEATAITGDISDAMLAGDLGQAFKKFKALQDKVAEIQGLEADAQALDKENKLKGLEKDLEDLKKGFKQGVADGFSKLRQRFPFGRPVMDQIEPAIMSSIDEITVETTVDQLGEVAKSFKTVFSENGPQLTGEWLRSKVDTVLSEGRKGAVDLLDGEVVPVLQALGFTEDTIGAIRSGLEGAVDSVDRATRDKANTYVLAVQELLRGVEDRRNLMQSPWRKIYRRLRKSDTLAFWGTIPGVLFAAAGIIAAFIPGLWANWFQGMLVAAASLLGGALVGWVVGHATLAAWRNAKGEGSGFTLGEFLQKVEKVYNIARGRAEQPEHMYGQVDKTVVDDIDGAGPTTIAKLLLEREDFHRDEEASRIRILRAISIIIGTYLAYLFKIDALDLLEQALPGVSQYNVSLTQDLTAGIVLTGLAASAGSKFWRDLLGRLQATKQQAESTAVMLRKAKATLGVEEQS